MHRDCRAQREQRGKTWRCFWKKYHRKVNSGFAFRVPAPSKTAPAGGLRFGDNDCPLRDPPAMGDQASGKGIRRIHVIEMVHIAADNSRPQPWPDQLWQ